MTHPGLQSLRGSQLHHLPPKAQSITLTPTSPAPSWTSQDFPRVYLLL